MLQQNYPGQLGRASIPRERRRRVAGTYQINLHWAVKGEGVAWFFEDHHGVNFPWWDGVIFSNEPLIQSFSSAWREVYAGNVESTSPGSYSILFDWVDKDGNVIPVGPAADDYALEIIVLGSTVNAGSCDMGIQRISTPSSTYYKPAGAFPTPVAGLKQTIVNNVPDADFTLNAGYKNAFCWMSTITDELI